MFGKGISASGSLLDAALRFEVIQKTGSWYSYGEERIGQGRDNAKLFLESNPDIAEAVEKRVRELLFTPKTAPEPVAAPNEEIPAPAESADSSEDDKSPGDGEEVAEPAPAVQKDAKSGKKGGRNSETGEGGGEDELF